MIALHAQGRKNDTIWLSSNLEPYKFNEAISDTGAYATESPRMWGGGGEGNVFSVGQRSNLSEMGTGEGDWRRPGTLGGGGGGVKAPPTLERSELSQGRAKRGGGGGGGEEGGEKYACAFLEEGRERPILK